ncbi:MAG: hypothetical protein ACYC9O_21010 [Candidatus Latescibacterota bacterium]
MKKIFFSFAFAFAFSILSAALASGQTGSTGVGVIIGEPTGISAKHFLSRRDAIDGALAWSLADDSRLHLHVDYLRHDFRVLQDEFDISEGQLPLFYGIGGRVRIDEDDSRVGVRFVIGVSYIFEDAPFDTFFEIAPIMDLVPETELNANAGIGFRYWF